MKARFLVVPGLQGELGHFDVVVKTTCLKGNARGASKASAKMRRIVQRSALADIHVGNSVINLGMGVASESMGRDVNLHSELSPWEIDRGVPTLSVRTAQTSTSSARSRGSGQYRVPANSMPTHDRRFVVRSLGRAGSDEYGARPLPSVPGCASRFPKRSARIPGIGYLNEIAAGRYRD
jgi:hypothetical protein